MARWYDRWYRRLLGPDRQYFLFDSFQGLPTVKEIDGPHAAAWQADVNNPGYSDNATASVDKVLSTLNLTPVSNYQIFKGSIRGYDADVCSSLQIALLRLDSNLYDPRVLTRRTWFHVWPRERLLSSMITLIRMDALAPCMNFSLIIAKAK